MFSFSPDMVNTVSLGRAGCLANSRPSSCISPSSETFFIFLKGEISVACLFVLKGAFQVPYQAVTDSVSWEGGPILLHFTGLFLSTILSDYESFKIKGTLLGRRPPQVLEGQPPRNQRACTEGPRFRQLEDSGVRQHGHTVGGKPEVMHHGHSWNSPPPLQQPPHFRPVSSHIQWPLLVSRGHQSSSFLWTSESSTPSTEISPKFYTIWVAPAHSGST